MPVIWLGYMAGGPNTKTYFYESSAHLLCAVTSGAPAVQTPHPAKAVKIDGITPMEAKFGVEMAGAASKLKREGASELVIELLQKYESQIGTAPSGSRYQECYDVTTGKPGEEYYRLYNEMKEELANMGVPFKQLIWEFGDDDTPQWVHIAFDKDNNKGQCLQAYKDNGRTKYREI